MPNYTENLQLEKPLQSEQYNIDVFNANADKIDQFAGQVPARALTADKLTTGAKINGVNFKGDTDIVTGAGFYYDTVTYGAGDLAFIYNQDGALELHKSLVDDNIGNNPLTSTGYWEKQDLGGSGGRNVGEIITSTLPLTDAGLHLLDGALINGSGIYSDFVDYIANIYKTKDRVYNPSAFTVVGSPTITADGIASGFSASNNITATLSTITPQSSIILKGKGIYSSTPNSANGSQTIGRLTGTNSSPSVEYNSSSGKITANRFHTNTGQLTSAQIELQLNDGDTLEYEVIATSTSVTLNVKVNGTSYTNTWNGNGLYFTAINGFQATYPGNYYWTGSIDLKQFSITVDGVEVLSGSTPANYFIDETTWQNTVTTYGVCGKFVYDSTNNTVRLPKVTGIVEGTTSVNALGTLIQAGLPNMTTSTAGGHNHNRGDMNITGGFATSGTDPWSWTGEANGAFSKTNFKSAGNNHDQNIDNAGFGINLNAANSWTGNTSWNGDHSHTVNTGVGVSSTVQPQTVKVLVYIVVATSVKTDIQVDIDNIATDLNGKADKDLNNLSTNGEKHFLNKTQISNCILEAPNGVITYSGNTITLKAGVKVLIPDGRNSDGTLKSIEITIPADVTSTLTESYIANREYQPLFIKADGGLAVSDIMPNGYFVTDDLTSGKYEANYSPKTNVMQITQATAGQWSTDQRAFIGYISIDNNLNITNANIEQPIKIFTSADKSYLAGLGMPSNKKISLTLGASNSTYIAPADGWVNFAKKGTDQQFIVLTNITNDMRVQAFQSTNSMNWNGIILPVKKNDTFRAEYTCSGDTMIFRFIYAQGSRK